MGKLFRLPNYPMRLAGYQKAVAYVYENTSLPLGLTGITDENGNRYIQLDQRRAVTIARPIEAVELRYCQTIHLR
jgi:hypothetical protein